MRNEYFHNFLTVPHKILINYKEKKHKLTVAHIDTTLIK